MRLAFLTACITCVAMSYSPACLAQSHSTHNVPQASVVCTGWHALCTASADCRMNGDKAYCDCLRVNENYIVVTSEIQDPAVKHMTLAKCTAEHPCNVDEAPVCKAIKYGNYEVDNVRYRWVPTYSCRGWCSLLQTKMEFCDPKADGYTRDLYWAVCDAAQCTENPNPSDPNKPLNCQCRVVEKVPFVGMNGTCTGDNGGIMSSSPAATWDFKNNTYLVPVPGLAYVQGACAPLKFDALPPPGSSVPPRKASQQSQSRRRADPAAHSLSCLEETIWAHI